MDYCQACAAPSSQGTLSDARVDEASGLVASKIHPHVYYLHNDSGDSARFFATDLTGADLGVYVLPEATANDWEDVALGPCAQGSCLYIADMGDNYRVRSDYALYRVPEPATVGPGEHAVAFERIPFAYPDGSHNAETLLAHPTTGELLIVTKIAFGPASAYRFPRPLTAGGTVKLEKVAELEPPTGTGLITGGDVHPAGTGLLLRTYTNVFYGRVEDGTLASALLGPLYAVPAATEAQGEAVAWRAAGDGWVTVSEGAQSPIYLTSCVTP